MKNGVLLEKKIQFVLFLTKNVFFLYKKTRAQYQGSSIEQLDFWFFIKGYPNIEPTIGPVAESDRILKIFSTCL